MQRISLSMLCCLAYLLHVGPSAFRCRLYKIGCCMQDQTQTDLINLRRTIYLTIMSSAQFEEAGHKLMKIQLVQGQEIEVVTMLIECCSQEKTYIR